MSAATWTAVAYTMDKVTGVAMDVLLDIAIKASPVEHPIDVSITFADDEPDLCKLLERHEYWPPESEGCSGRIDPDGTVHCQCPNCDAWIEVRHRVDIWGTQQKDWVARCEVCWEPECHYGSGATALMAAQDLFA